MTDNCFSFVDRLAVLATMHRKEEAIAPILEQQLGLKIVVPDNFNTDTFGTFTREIPRAGTQIEAARSKAERAIELTGESIAIASEGSFLPHPMLPYIAQNREIVLFLDKAEGLEIIGQEVSLETNYSHQLVSSFEEAETFAKKAGFPEHGLIAIVRRDLPEQNQIFKGITTPAELQEVVEYALKNSIDGKAHLETDMRAMYNPTRMKAIAKATLDLVRKIQHKCPNCGAPGLEIVSTRKGLPCEACGAPTLLTLAAQYQCKKCHFSQENLYPENRKTADPGQCEYCNP